MDIRINSKDDVGLLTESSIRSTPYGSRPNSQRTSGLNSSRVSDLPNTIHYLSPASTAAHTICEGDFDYQDLYYLPMIHELPVTRARSTSTSSSSTSVPCEENILQRTLAIIKPEAVEFQDVVLRAVDKAGFRIVHRRNIHLTPEQVSEIYEKYYGTPAFPHMVISMSAGPIVSLSLQAINAVEKWKNLIGPMGTLREEWFFPYSVRTRFGLYRDIPNVLHASDNANEAKMENKYVYPRDILEPLPSDFQKVKDFVTVFLKPTLVSGLAEIVKTKPIDPVISLAEWLLLHNPYQPKLPEAIAVTPT
ncbi:nucleoside diphosphate kinase homolog 5-like [Sitophilus oryzae]|uniref:Nucleoside diphosphate kinase homolog 5-like n=1 Tax=Sitophilus oryzae TaxID=7048 RepID=A0A6J2XNZ6_SITOR|nr:nucleoside diphosphate kinase homolog 5-like [Sitophilus oryzae]